MGVQNLPAELRAKGWNQDGVKKLVKGSLWYQLSNYTDTTKGITNANDFKKIPSAVMLTVSDELKMGKTSVTIPWFDELKGTFRGGSQKEEGNEESTYIKPLSVYYNLFRKSTTISDESVDSDSTEFYDLASKAKDALFTFYGKFVDFCCQQAVCEGADIMLTDPQYWIGNTFTSNPLAKTIHPRVMVDTATDFVSWNNTYSTYEGNIDTAGGAMSVANLFNLTTVAKIASIASRTIAPLGWKYGNQKVDWIIKITPIQANQLMTDTTAVTGIIARSANAEERGMDNRALTGVIGIWFNCLVVEDQRAPIYNHSASAGSKFSYYRPDYLVNSDPTRTAHGNGAASGTCEIAMVLGNKSLANAVPMLPKLVNKDSTDYKFDKSMAIMAKAGYQRPDFRASTDTTRPVNESSFLYMTATPSNIYLG